MQPQSNELARVAREQLDLYERMTRSVWGDRLLMAMTASMLGGLGLGMVLAGRRSARAIGAMLYAAAAGMELYVAMTPKQKAERERLRGPEEAGGEPATRAA